MFAKSMSFKIWFRELPAPILNAIPPDIIKTAELESAINACNYLRETERNILFWLVDVLCEYVKNEKENKMTSQNLGKIFNSFFYSKYFKRIDAIYFFT